MDKQGILKLANLSRIDLSETEAGKFSNEFDKILEYVGEVKIAVKTSAKLETGNKERFIPRNVFRSDEKPHKKGIYTEAILEQAPAREKNYIKVKKIL